MNIDLLKNELLTTFKIRPIDIKLIVPKIQKRRYEEECIYLLYFQRKDNIKIENLRNITGLFNIKVNWKYYSSKSHGPTQCSNCQDFGHGIENCHLKPKCIRCGGEHSSSKCPHLPKPTVDEKGNKSVPELKIPDEKIQCANCGQSHTANFRGCAYRRQYIEIQEQFKPRRAPQPKRPKFDQHNFPPLSSANTRMNEIFPSMSQNQTPYQQPQPRGLHSHVECSQIMSELLSRLPQCHTIEDQIKLIYEMSFRYTHGSSK